MNDVTKLYLEREYGWEHRDLMNAISTFSSYHTSLVTESYDVSPLVYIDKRIRRRIVPGLYLDIEPVPYPSVVHPFRILLRTSRGTYTRELDVTRGAFRRDVVLFSMDAAPAIARYAGKFRRLRGVFEDRDEVYFAEQMDAFYTYACRSSFSFLEKVYRRLKRRARREVQVEAERIPAWIEFLHRLKGDDRLNELTVKWLLRENTKLDDDFDPISAAITRCIKEHEKAGRFQYHHVILQANSILNVLFDGLRACYEPPRDRRSRSSAHTYLIKDHIAYTASKRERPICTILTDEQGKPVSPQDPDSALQSLNSAVWLYASSFSRLFDDRIDRIIEFIDSLLDRLSPKVVGEIDEELICIL